MKRCTFLMLVSLVAFSAPPKRSTTFHQNISPRPNSALVDANDRIFPDIVEGGGWETVITFVNMSGARAQFTLTFYDDDGNPLPLPIANPDGSISRFASTDFALEPSASSELVVANADNNVTSAWSYVSFVSGTSAVAGQAVVRNKDSNGNVLTESTEALSNTQDSDFFASYDNLEGVVTTLILLNPGNNQPANVRLSALDATGNEIVRDRFSLPPGAREIIVLTDAYPVLQNTSGQLRVTGDANNLSAICYRTTPTGSIAYSPIFNWTGMFR